MPENEKPTVEKTIEQINAEISELLRQRSAILNPEEAPIEVVPRPAEPEDPTIKVGGASGVGAAVSGAEGSITRYKLDRARYGGLAAGKREIVISPVTSNADEQNFIVRTDGHYRITEEGEGTAGFTNKKMTPAGEWKNEKTNAPSPSSEMESEEIQIRDAESTAEANNFASPVKLGTMGHIMKSGSSRRYEVDQAELDAMDAFLADDDDVHVNVYTQPSVGRPRSAEEVKAYEDSVLQGEDGAEMKALAESVAGEGDDPTPDDYEGVKTVSHGEVLSRMHGSVEPEPTFVAGVERRFNRMGLSPSAAARRSAQPRFAPKRDE